VVIIFIFIPREPTRCACRPAQRFGKKLYPSDPDQYSTFLEGRGSNLKARDVLWSVAVEDSSSLTLLFLLNCLLNWTWNIICIPLTHYACPASATGSYIHIFLYDSTPRTEYIARGEEPE
jgi:hypothetical protein